MMRRTGRSSLIAFPPLFCLVAALSCAAAPATQPSAASGGITGRVTASGEVPLSEMVVYLESPDPGRAIEAPREPVKVSQRGARFAPALVIVCAGQSVDFLNDEDRNIEHSVFSNAPPKKFDLGMYPPGQSRTVVFDKPGAVFLYCAIHKYMDGVVYVSPTPYFSRVSADGRYAIEGVPAGNWVLKTWQRRRRFKEDTAPIVVEPGKNQTLDLELKRR